MDKDRSYAEIEVQVIALLQQLLAELGVSEQRRYITGDAHLDRDLGIDSLSKVEFFHRIEKAFDISLPEVLLEQAQTLGDFVVAVQQIKPEVMRAAKSFAPTLPQARVKPQQAPTLVDLLYLYGEQTPDRPHIYLRVEQGVEQTITYGQLLQKAQAIACGLKQFGIRRGETVAIMLPTCEGYFYAFFGILLAGAIPVSIYPPFRPDQIGEYALRESAILKNAEVRLLITSHQAEKVGKLLRVFITSLKAVVTVDELLRFGDQLKRVQLNTDDAAIIQYTSGSTAAPKGVLLSHYNLLTNIRISGEAAQIQPTDVCVSWLPLYHDMGLIGAWLGSFYHGIPVVIMSPIAFLTAPERWLWALHYHRGTISASPNFGYELCVKRIETQDIKGLDLSAWRLACNGAEAINPNTLARFAKKFKPYHFKSSSLYPVYGLAECALALCFPKLPFKKYRLDKIERSAFECERQARPVTANKVPSLTFVSCGTPLAEHAVRITNDQGEVLGERQVGNLEFKGPSSMQGYFRNPKATAQVYHDGWIDSGDLAYLADGEVFICGRKKDVVIKAGRNLYPEEVEDIVAQVDEVRKGCVVVFGVMDQVRATERLIVVAEVKTTSAVIKTTIKHAIVEKTTMVLGLPPDEILLVPAQSIPKTSSGKLRRSECKKYYLEGRIKKPAMPMWWQLFKLGLRAAAQKVKVSCQLTGKIIYTTYVGVLALLLCLPFVMSVLMMPQRAARKLARLWMRLLLWLMGCPVHIKGRAAQVVDKPVVYTVNHASFIDTIVLMAILPTHTIFVAKRELARVVFLNRLMRKFGTILIARFDFEQSMADTERIKAALKTGHAIVIFPEGMFTYAAGLRPFKLGAFKVAVETHSVVCPVALAGTRSILRDESMLLSPGRIDVYLSDCLKPKGQGFSAIVALSQAARTEIAAHCGEQMLNL